MLGSMIHLMANIKGMTADDVRKEIKESPELQKRFLDLYTDFKQREMTDVTDIRVSGHNGETVSDIKKGLLEVASLFSGNQGNPIKGNPTKESQTKKSSLGETGEFSER